MKSWKNDEILKKIRGATDERKAVVKYLVQNQVLYNKAKYFVIQNSGREDEAKMIYHDVIVAFVSYVFKHREFQLSSSYEAYMMQMIKNRWISELRKKGREPLLAEKPEYEEELDTAPLMDDMLMTEERRNLLFNVLSKMRQRCKEVLMYWANGYRMKEIAELLSYKSEGMVRKKKSDCMKELYGFLESHPHVVAQLKEI